MLCIESCFKYDSDLFWDDIEDLVIVEQTETNLDKIGEHYLKTFTPEINKHYNELLTEYLKNPYYPQKFNPTQVKLKDNEWSVGYEYFDIIYNFPSTIHYLYNRLEEVCEYADSHNISCVLIYIKKRPDIVNGAGLTMFEALAIEYDKLDITIRLY